jgi:hypothetical protein
LYTPPVDSDFCGALQKIALCVPLCDIYISRAKKESKSVDLIIATVFIGSQEPTISENILKRKYTGRKAAEWKKGTQREYH